MVRAPTVSDRPIRDRESAGRADRPTARGPAAPRRVVREWAARDRVAKVADRGAVKAKANDVAIAVRKVPVRKGTGRVVRSVLSMARRAAPARTSMANMIMVRNLKVRRITARNFLARAVLAINRRAPASSRHITSLDRRLTSRSDLVRTTVRAASTGNTVPRRMARTAPARRDTARKDTVARKNA